MERLQKVIAQSGYTSRRKAEELITLGRVKVNGIVVKTLGTKVSDNDEITIDNKPLGKEKKVYYLLNKPKGYICSASDEKGRKTILDLIDVKERIYPVGRLDYFSSGIIILTNDGNFTNKVIHPKYQLEKEYKVKIEGRLTKKEIMMIEEGLSIDDKTTYQPALINVIKASQKSTSFLITIHEGKNHEIRNMMEYFNHPVISLHRIRIGNITDDNLSIGSYRKLKKEERKQLLDLIYE